MALKIGALPPGVPFLSTLVLKLVLPVFALKYTYALADWLSLVHAPQYIRILSYLAVNPAIVILRRQWHDHWNSREARRRGAVLAPLWEGRTIGSIDLIKQFVDSFNNDYIGEYFPSIV